MKTYVTIVAAGLFALASISTATACGFHSSKTADISKPVSTAQGPIITPAPKPEG